MKNIFKTIIGALLVLSMGSCTKEVAPPGAASLTIINSVIGTSTLIPNFRGTAPIRYATGSRLLYGFYLMTYNRTAVPAGHCALGLFMYPDTLADSQPLFLFDLDLPAASIHTLFLTGTVDAPESILVKEELPYYAASDSTMGLRFMNLSPGSMPISVNLKNEEAGSEARELAYKDRTGFQRYPVRKDQANYVFEFRNAETGELIASYTARGVGNSGSTVNTWLFRNFTLALIGKVGGGILERPQVLLVPHSG